MPQARTVTLGSLADVSPPTDPYEACVIFAPLDCALSICSEAENWLSPEEKNRVARLCFEGDRRRRRGAYILQRFLLARAFRVDPCSFRFEWDKRGKPRLLGAGGIDANLSHSGEWLAAGVSTLARIGIDVESDNRQVDWPAIAPFFLHPHEREIPQSMTEAQTRSFYLERWCLKEAFVKAMGVGFSIGPETLLPEQCVEGWSIPFKHTELVAGAIQPAHGMFGAWAVSAGTAVTVYLVNS